MPLSSPKMKRIYCFMLMLLASHVYGQHNTSLPKEDRKESKITDMIANLPEVIKADHYYHKKSHGKRHLVTFIDSRPGKTGKYYALTVAEDNGDAMVGLYHFVVDKDTYVIKYVDENENYIPLSVWRRQKNYRSSN